MRAKFKKLIIDSAYIVYRTIRLPLKWYWKIFKIDTHGLRILIVHNNSLVLVRHWYNGLWVMPGGGIKKTESPEEAAVREVFEETGISIQNPDYKLGAYSNTKGGKRDTVHCFVIKLSERPVFKERFRFEISDIKLCPFDELPEGTSYATKLRIQEYLKQDISKELRPWS